MIGQGIDASDRMVRIKIMSIPMTQGYPLHDDRRGDVECENIVQEIYTDDVYNLMRIVHPSDVWVDVGCHAGVFTRAILELGSTVFEGYDSSLDRYLDYLQIGELYDIPYFTHQQVSDVNLPFPTRNDDDPNPNALKMDIQGGERVILENPRAVKRLAEQYDKILFEWHFNATDEMIETRRNLIDNGYHIYYFETAIDILTEEPTFIVYAAKSGVEYPVNRETND